MTSQRPSTTALAALAFGLAATVFGWWTAGRQVRNELQGEFADQAIAGSNLVERRIQRYVDALYGMQALAAHDFTLRRHEFHNFVLDLQLAQRLPGVQAVEYIRRVPEAQREASRARYGPTGPCAPKVIPTLR